MDVRGTPAGPGQRSALRALASAARPAQWVKNLAILVPLVFSRRATEPAYLARALVAFAAFCLLSAATYIGNDLADRTQDRAHPRKRYRAIAAGELAPRTAGTAAAVLAALGLALSSSLGLPFVLAATGYLALQVAYTAVLKRVAVVDVFAIAAGFVLRVVAGAEAVDVPVSNWLYLTTVFLALFLALEKRRSELMLLGEGAVEHRGILAEYTSSLLDQLVAVAASGTVVTYSLYTLAPDTLRKFGTDRLKYTVPVVLFGVSRYLYLVHRRGEGGEPERVLLRDRVMELAVLGYAAVVGWAIYGRRP